LKPNFEGLARQKSALEVESLSDQRLWGELRPQWRMVRSLKYLGAGGRVLKGFDMKTSKNTAAKSQNFRKGSFAAVLLTVLVAFAPSFSMAANNQGAQKGPFKSRTALMKALFNSGFHQIIEFEALGIRNNILSQTLNGQQDVEVKKTPLKTLASNLREADRIKSMDYLHRGIGKAVIMGKVFGDILYEAYNVSNIAICHKVTDAHINENAGKFVYCIVFPRPVEEVMKTLEENGVIEQADVE